MTKFTGTNNADIADAFSGTIVGFTPNDLAALLDGNGDLFIGRGGDDFVNDGDGDEARGGDGNDILDAMTATTS